MTKEEAAQKFVDMLTEQQCREFLKDLLLRVLSGVFDEVERLTTPENTQTIQDNQPMQNFRQNIIGDYNVCRCAELRKG